MSDEKDCDKGNGNGKDISELRTVRSDPRYQNTNQTRACYAHYCDYFRCIRLLGEGCDACELFKTWYTTMCPTEWVEKWDTMREEGCFPGKI